LSLYVPQAFAVADPAACLRLIQDFPFATLVTPGVPEPQVSHVPLLLLADGGPNGTLIGHVARANPHWRHAEDTASIAIFHGPHAYVSPSWYGEPAKMVPTWNYATVHAHGMLEIVADSAAAWAILDALVQRFEDGRVPPWRFARARRDRDMLLSGIVAFRIRVQRFEAKFKLSQNRTQADRGRVIAALAQEDRPDAQETAAWMRSYAPPDGDA
jgi:transcriptional regulator